MGNSPKLRPAKMTDTLRTAFGFKEGSHVTISKTTAHILHADRITLTDVTPSDYVGTTFDVSAKKGLRKRFYVEHIEPSGTQAGSHGLFICDDKTHFNLSGGLPAPEAIILPNGDAFPVLDTSRIGGLVEQVKELNMRLDRLLHKFDHPHGSANRHVLLHGYEGTGKSLVLNRLAQTTACKVFRLGRVQMASGRVLATIESTFRDAFASQPSVILMDNIEKLASSESELYADAIGMELDKLRGADVLVVAATRSPLSVDSSLTGPGRLSRQIELAIPDVPARRQILNVLMGKPVDSHDFATIAAKTHGFTGKDLGLLVEEANDTAFSKVGSEKEGWVDVHARISMLHSPHNSQVDGSVHSQATTQVQQLTDTSPERADLNATVEDFEVALSVVRPTALREIFFETPKVQWSDIGGSDANKQRFDEIIGWPLHHPELMEQFEIPPQKGVLLYGPPGCSKTMTAQAVASTYDLNFIAVKGAELISMYVGESERAVREVFRKARQAAPCIVFFDEIDAIGAERESGGTKGLNVLTTLLNEMDGFEAMKDVLVLAATNKPEVLDPALLRPGRFDEHVYVGLPTANARKEILKMSLKVPVDLTHFDELVDTTQGYSGAEIVAICTSAKRCAVRRMMASAGSPDVGLHAGDFKAAISQVRKGVTDEMLSVYDNFASR
ncbi:hypothetical protein LTR36_006625 [Oleoguttula mirabilis]|uniref:AAA+ ATPase domain-containing protein n=1 Tax=Oleoguttula mirabilis TaxID=1507867 RepID=A0AAV9JCP3_9PEZI|nr:hypothetical protein LTR36_006625 [Oleoguttula mirabilis]